MMLEKLEACFMRLQTLKLDMTEHNMSVLLQTLYDLRDVYAQIQKTTVAAEPAPDAETKGEQNV